MTIRRELIIALLLAFPVFSLLAQQPNPSATQNQDLNLQPLPSDAPSTGPQSGTHTPMLQVRPAIPASGWHRFDEPDQVEQPSLPLTLTLPAGTWINLRIDQGLSSDHNRPGDVWSGTLIQPLIADGRVIARRGQTVNGNVTTAERAGQMKGVSRLGLDLNELTLADGRRGAIKTRLMEFNGPTTKGRDAAAIGTTVGTGAMIGAIFGGGLGAGIGAAAGAVASTIGVLVTRGEPTNIYPESLLRFRTEAPMTVAVNTASSAHAFVPVRPTDYQSGEALMRPAPAEQGAAPPPTSYAAYPYYPYGPNYYPPYYYSPYYYWPSIGFSWGWGPYWYGGYGYYHGGHGHYYYGSAHGWYGGHGGGYHGGGGHGGGHGGHH